VASTVLGGSAHTVKENTEALVVATKEIRPEVNADKIKYMIMSRDQKAGRIYSMKILTSACLCAQLIGVKPSLQGTNVVS
jgi:hypothetical protein